jgi:hypothetical protein
VTIVAAALSALVAMGAALAEMACSSATVLRLGVSSSPSVLAPITRLYRREACVQLFTLHPRRNIASR